MAEHAETDRVAYLDDLEGFFVASTARASRAARSPPPSSEAEIAAWATINATATAFEAAGLQRLSKMPPTELAKPTGRRGPRCVGSHAGSSKALVVALDSNAPARPTAQLSHVFSLQRPIDSNAREATHLVYQNVLPLEATQLAAAGMRSNSVRASVVHKAKKTQGGGQQTTRNNLSDLSAAWATQAASVAATMGAARFLCKHRHGYPVSDPSATMALDTATLVANETIPETTTAVFIVASTTRLLPHALPTRVASHSFLDTMKVFAQSELEMGVIRARVPQQVESLRAVCNSIVDSTEGVNVWAAWALLVHMLSDPRLRRMVQTSPISDMEAATAFLFQGYARAEITRRARLETEPKSGTKKKQKTTKDDEEEPEIADYDELLEENDDDDAKAETASVSEASTDATMQLVVQFEKRDAADQHTLSLKRKRPPNVGPVQTMSGAFLDYWAAALHSSYAAILKMMITQSKSLANSAAMDTLVGQAPDGIRIKRNALLVDISCKNAIKSAEAISSLVVVSEARVPKILTWRARDAQNRIRCHVGLIRSVNDASNTTLHACRLGHRSRRNHLVCVWSLAVRNTTPRDNTTAILPGIMEGAAHLRALETQRIQFSSRHHLARVFDQVKHKAARAASDGSLPLALTGIARGIVVLRGRFVFGMSTVAAGVEMAAAMAAARDSAGAHAALAPQTDFESCALLSHEPLDPKKTTEPFATPSNNIALALQVNEQLRTLLKNRSHRGDPCRHLTGVTTPQDLQEPSVEEIDKPQSLLPIVDCKIDFLEDPTTPGVVLPNRRDACLRKAAVTLTVCGDAPVRLVDLLDLFCRSSDAAGPALCFEATSLLLGGAARASEVNDLAGSVCAGHVNSSIASAKRILVGDLNLRPYLTIYQVFRVGLSNVPRSFETTPWSGAYGAGFDIGTSAGIGIRASSTTADKRCFPFGTTNTHLVTSNSFCCARQEPRQAPDEQRTGRSLVRDLCILPLHESERHKLRGDPARSSRRPPLLRRRTPCLPQRPRRGPRAGALASEYRDAQDRRLPSVPSDGSVFGAHRAAHFRRLRSHHQPAVSQH